MESNSTRILKDDFTPLPSRILINGNETQEINTSYNFSESTNIVKLIWDIELYDCSSMFESCEAKKINFSEFNSRNVIDM